MHARITTYEVKQDKVDELVSKLEEIKAQIKAIPGVVSSYSVWRQDGHGVTAAIYESRAAADAASGKVQSIWSGIAELLAAAPNVETYDNVANLLD